jgi:hypothetical protein
MASFNIGTFHLPPVALRLGPLQGFGLISAQRNRARRCTVYGDAKPIIKEMLRLVEPKFLLISRLLLATLSDAKLEYKPRTKSPRSYLVKRQVANI